MNKPSQIAITFNILTGHEVAWDGGSPSQTGSKS